MKSFVIFLAIFAVCIVSIVGKKKLQDPSVCCSCPTPENLPSICDTVDCVECPTEKPTGGCCSCPPEIRPKNCAFTCNKVCSEELGRNSK